MQRRDFGAPGAILVECCTDDFQQLLFVEWLRQEIQGPRLDGANAGGDVAMTGDKDDRRMVSARHLPLQIEAVNVRQLDIEHQAGRHLRLGVSHVRRCGSERHRVQTGGRQQVLQRLAQAAVIVDDQYDGVCRRHSDVLRFAKRMVRGFMLRRSCRCGYRDPYSRSM
jgi:hypothetical protein